MARWWHDYGTLLVILATIEAGIGASFLICLRVSGVRATRWWGLLLLTTVVWPPLLCLAGTLLPNRPHQPGVMASSIEAIALFAMPIVTLALLVTTIFELLEVAWPWRAAVVLLGMAQLAVDLLAIVAAAQLFAGVSL